MPFASMSQRRKFYALKNEGKMDQATIDEWEKDTPKNIPERKIMKTASAFWQGFFKKAEENEQFLAEIVKPGNIPSALQGNEPPAPDLITIPLGGKKKEEGSYLILKPVPKVEEGGDMEQGVGGIPGAPMPEGQMPEQMPGQMPGQMPEQMPEQMPGQMPGQMPEQMPGQMPGQMMQPPVNEGQAVGQQAAQDLSQTQGEPQGTTNQGLPSEEKKEPATEAKGTKKDSSSGKKHVININLGDKTAEQRFFRAFGGRHGLF